MKIKRLSVFFFSLLLLQCFSSLVAAQEKEAKWTKAGKEVSEAVEAVSVATQETWRQTKEEASEVWQKTKQHSSDVLTEAKKSSGDVAEVTKKESKTLWQKTKQMVKDVYQAVKLKIHNIISPDEEVSRV